MRYPSLTPLFEGNPRTQGQEILSRKTRDLEGAHGEDFVILACTVLIQVTSVTDRQTNRQTSIRRWLRRAKHSAVSRKNNLIHVTNGETAGTRKAPYSLWQSVSSALYAACWHTSSSRAPRSFCVQKHATWRKHGPHTYQIPHKQISIVRVTISLHWPHVRLC